MADLDSSNKDDSIVKPVSGAAESSGSAGDIGDKPLPPLVNDEYVRALREENKKYRLKSIENEKKAQDAEKKAQEEFAKETRASLEKIEKIQSAYEQKIQKDEQRIIKGELKTAALQAGLKNVDYLQLFDKSDLKLSDDGDVIGLEKAISDVKTKYPDLFKVASSANEGADAPFADLNKGEKPTYATPAEFEAAKRAYLKQNRK